MCLKVTGDLKFSEVNVNMIEANKRTYDFIKTQKIHKNIWHSLLTSANDGGIT